MKNCVGSALLCIFALGLCHAQGTEKGQLLKPEEAAEGWLALFDGDTTFGWKLENGEIKASDGMLVLGGQKQTKVLFPIVGFGEGTFQQRYEGADAPSLVLERRLPGQDPSVAKTNLSSADVNGQRQWIPTKWSIKAGTAPGAGVSSGGNLSDNRLESYIAFTAGADALPRVHFEIPAGTTLYLKDVKYKPTGLKSIFNGKDLAGWKEVPGHKSKFSVTPEGWLNVKDGNGDLQTEEQWDDLILQIDVISNGKHLNSGVFFRCLPGQFWSGYEAQVRNEWKGDDRTKAVDYGTGGIYNRQPARKVVSSDNEWFTMTVLAYGDHMATWVNGYQVTDHVDTRPKHQSARSGLKLDKGPVSLQGHDPTTDLSFRNIKIVDLPK